MNGPVISEFTQHQLEEALYHAVDITDRSMLPFMLVGETARSIIEDNCIKGDGIYLGAREKDVAEFVVSTIRTLAKGADSNLGIQDFKEDESGYTWTYRGVPISIQVIRKPFSVLQNPNFVWYMAEQYKIPNPFAKYWQIRNLIK